MIPFGRYTNDDPLASRKVPSDLLIGRCRERNLKDGRETVEQEFGIETMIKSGFLLRSLPVIRQSAALQIPTEPIKVGSVTTTNHVLSVIVKQFPKRSTEFGAIFSR